MSAVTSPMAPVDAAPALPAVRVDRLRVSYRSRRSSAEVLKGISFEIGQGEAYGLVGESGCGKSTAAFAVVRYLHANGTIDGGSVEIAGRDIYTMPEPDLRDLRRREVSMVYQNPGASLNPSMRIGQQVAEVFGLLGVASREAWERGEELLRQMRIRNSASVMQRYPHQISGGMQQRVVIGMALAKNPRLLILDEPTTALDATVEAGILELLREIRAEFGTSMLFISHNLEVVGRMCDRVGVMYAGEIVEEGSSEAVFSAPRHPYTAALLRCVPEAGSSKGRGQLETISGSPPAPGSELTGCLFADRCPLTRDDCREQHPDLLAVDGRLARCLHHEEVPAWARREAPEIASTSARSRAGETVLSVRSVSKSFGDVLALDEVSFDLAAGETLGLVGESGSGKSTLGRAIAGLMEPDAGEIEIDGRTVAGRISKRSDDDVRAIQVVFQNPESALNPRHRVSAAIERAVRKLGGARPDEAKRRARGLLDDVRFPEHLGRVRPRELSGGLKQRVAIARAFADAPRVIVCDEPTSALDVSVQAAILNLFVELQKQTGIAYVFVSHDLAVVEYMADRIAVLYHGKIVEIGPAEAIVRDPRHPYTRVLMQTMAGAVPAAPTTAGSPAQVDDGCPTGCIYQGSCPRKLGAICETERPPAQDAGGGRVVQCHIPVDELRHGPNPSTEAPQDEATTTGDSQA